MQLFRERAGDALDFGDRFPRERDRRRNRRGVPGVAPGRLDVFENRADDCSLSVRHAIDVKLDGVCQELVDEDCLSTGNLHRLIDVFPEPVFVVNDRHAASAKDERGTHQDWIADLISDPDCVIDRMCDAARRLLHADIRDEIAEEVAVFRERNVFRRRAENVYARRFQPFREV